MRGETATEGKQNLLLWAGSASRKTLYTAFLKTAVRIQNACNDSTQINTETI